MGHCGDTADRHYLDEGVHGTTLTQLLVFISRDLKAMVTTFMEQGRPYLFTEPAGMASRPDTDTPLFPSSSGGYQMVDFVFCRHCLPEAAERPSD